MLMVNSTPIVIRSLTGVFPPNGVPEEILSDHPDRLRAILCSSSNPLRSYADTTAYEKAFSRLDLLVTCELAMTETARLSHYVLPACSAYESWDGSFFAWTFPEIYFQMRRPIIKPEGEQLEVSQIMVRLAEALGEVVEQGRLQCGQLFLPGLWAALDQPGSERRGGGARG